MNIEQAEKLLKEAREELQRTEAAFLEAEEVLEAAERGLRIAKESFTVTDRASGKVTFNRFGDKILVTQSGLPGGRNRECVLDTAAQEGLRRFLA